MRNRLAMDKLAAAIRAKRGERGLREAAKEIEGVSPSTLSRIEQGKMPDLGTFTNLCNWLGVKPEEFFVVEDGENEPNAEIGVVHPPGSSTPDAIEAHLRAAKELNPETADALANMVRAAFKAITSSTPDTIAAHLRANKELNPDTTEALANMVRAAQKAIVDGKIGRRRSAH